jgi:hypothetical protein
MESVFWEVEGGCPKGRRFRVDRDNCLGDIKGGVVIGARCVRSGKEPEEL